MKMQIIFSEVINWIIPGFKTKPGFNPDSFTWNDLSTGVSRIVNLQTRDTLYFCQRQLKIFLPMDDEGSILL